MALRSITIDLLMATGAFETDTKRAEKALDRLQKRAEAFGKGLGVALGAGAVAAAVAFEKLTAGAAEFKDLEEQTGASAESLASLSVSAKVAGLEISDVTANVNRLTKSLVDADDDSKAIGAALSALGIPIEQFKSLDPVGQIDALTAAFNGFADGSGKTAVAMQLFGKNGATMLGLFKELEAAGGRQVILTQQQIDLADEYGDKQTRLTATLTQYAQAAVSDMLPALNVITGVAKDFVAELINIDTEGKKLGGDSSVRQWSEAAAGALAVFADDLRNTGVEITKFVAQTQKEFATLKAGAIIAANPGRIGEAIAFGTGPVADALRERNETVKEANAVLLATQENDGKKYQNLVAKQFQDQRDSERNRSIYGFGARPGLPVLTPQATGKDGKGQKEKTSEAQRYLETLQKQAEKTLELSTYEQALLDIQERRIKGLTPELERQILAQAQFNDENKRAIELRDTEVAALTAQSKARLDALETQQKANKELADEIAKMGLTQTQLTTLEIQRLRDAAAIKEQTRAKQEAEGVDETRLQVIDAEIAALREREGLLTQQLNKQSTIDQEDAAERLKESTSEAAAEGLAEGVLEGARNSSASMAELFKKELKAQLAKTVVTPLLKPVVDVQNDLVKQLLGGVQGLFGGSGLSIDTSGYSYQGATLPNSLRGGADGGTNLVKRDMATMLHKGEAFVPEKFNPWANGTGVGNASQIQVVNNLGVQATAREEQQRNPDGTVTKRIMLDAVASDIAKGGKVARAAQSRLGTGAGNLPRRA